MASLLEKHPNLRYASEDDEFSTPLLFTAIHHDYDIFLEFLKNVKSTADIGKVTNKFGRNALHYSCAYGKTGVISYLLHHKLIDVNSIDTEGNTALHRACYYGEKEVVSKLLENKADVYLQNRYGNTCIEVAKKDNGTLRIAMGHLLRITHQLGIKSRQQECQLNIFRIVAIAAFVLSILLIAADLFGR